MRVTRKSLKLISAQMTFVTYAFRDFPQLLQTYASIVR
jgi:hypothetical protein